MISQCIQQMAMKILKENPNIANNPNAQSMINVIQSGDEKRGQEIAENICKSMDAKDQTIASQQAAVPAFTVPNPYANYGFGCYCGSTNNGCC